MKKFAFITLCAMCIASICTSCNNGKLQEAENRNAALSDSIAGITAAQDSLIVLLTEVTNGVSQIKEMEKIINSTDFNRETPSQKESILSDMQLIAETLKARRERIDELEKKLKKSGNYSRQAEESVKALKNQVAQQAAEIETLQAALKDANVKIEDLTNQVSSLNTTVENVTSQRDAAEQEAVRIANELNTCYYVIGSNKELKANNIIQKKFLGKTKVMEGDYELSYFTKADKRSLTEIPLHSAKAKVMTKQPAGSYEIIDKDGVKTLRITNATKFWELSNFLVIQID